MTGQIANAFTKQLSSPLQRDQATMGKKGESTTTLCYVRDPDHAWVPAVLEKTEGNKAHVSIPQYKDEQSIVSDGGRGARGEPVKKVISLKDYAHGVLPLQNVDKNGCLTAHADMVKLPYLHEVCCSFLAAGFSY